jgi:hypothetical protein
MGCTSFDVICQYLLGKITCLKQIEVVAGKINVPPDSFEDQISSPNR